MTNQNTHLNKDPKNPFCVVSFLSASAINANAFCSLSAISNRWCYQFPRFKQQLFCNSIWKLYSKFNVYSVTFTQTRSFLVFCLRCIWLRREVKKIICIVGSITRIYDDFENILFRNWNVMTRFVHITPFNRNYDFDDLLGISSKWVKNSSFYHISGNISHFLGVYSTLQLKIWEEYYCFDFDITDMSDVQHWTHPFEYRIFVLTTTSIHILSSSSTKVLFSMIDWFVDAFFIVNWWSSSSNEMLQMVYIIVKRQYKHNTLE